MHFSLRGHPAGEAVDSARSPYLMPSPGIRKEGFSHPFQWFPVHGANVTDRKTTKSLQVSKSAASFGGKGFSGQQRDREKEGAAETAAGYTRRQKRVSQSLLCGAALSHVHTGQS